MTKKTIFTSAIAAFLVTGLAIADAQGLGAQGPGRRGPAGQLLGAPGRGFGGRLGGGRFGGGPLAGLAAVGLTDDQQAKLKTILDESRAEELARREKTRDAILSLLTPEQKAKLGRKK